MERSISRKVKKLSEELKRLIAKFVSKNGINWDSLTLMQEKIEAIEKLSASYKKLFGKEIPAEFLGI